MEDKTARKPFGAFVQEQRNGALHGELSDGLADLVQAVTEHKKPGTLTVAIKVTPNGDNVIVTDKVTLKAPEGERGASIFFPDTEGNLSRRNPAQPADGELREVPPAKVAAV